MEEATIIAIIDAKWMDPIYAELKTTRFIESFGQQSSTSKILISCRYAVSPSQKNPQYF